MATRISREIGSFTVTSQFPDVPRHVCVEKLPHEKGYIFGVRYIPFSDQPGLSFNFSLIMIPDGFS